MQPPPVLWEKLQEEKVKLNKLLPFFISLFPNNPISALIGRMLGTDIRLQIFLAISGNCGYKINSRGHNLWVNSRFSA